MLDNKMATIGATDRGFLLGDGAFETLYVHDNTAEYFERHMTRLRSTLEALSIVWNCTDADVRHGIFQVLASNNIKNAAVRITVTRGMGPRGIEIPVSAKPTTLITASNFVREKALVTVTVSRYKRNETCPLSPLKTLGYLPQIMARQEAKKKEYTDALMLNSKNDICCASSANIFFVCGRSLITPDISQGCLAGIMRTQVIAAALKIGLNVQQRRIAMKEIKMADAAFLTNSLVRIQGVVAIDQKSYPETHPHVENIVYAL